MKSIHTISLLLLMLTCVSCSRKEEPPQNLHLMAALRTAVSAQNATWLAQTKAQFETATQKGEVSDETAKAFRQIFAAAEAGDWAAAEKQTLKLQKNSKPHANGSADGGHVH